MTIFGLDSAQVMRLASAVLVDADAEIDESGAAEVFARASWSGIAEPGDSVAGVLVTALGPAQALNALVDGWAMERVAGAVGDVVADSVTTRDLTLAFERWRPRLVSNAVITSLRQAARVSARLIRPTDRLWPAGVDDLGAHAPIALWARGIDAAVESLGSSYW